MEHIIINMDKTKGDVDMNTKILLYAAFPHKEKFDFECEAYENSVIFLLEKGSFEYRIEESESEILHEGEFVICPKNKRLYRKVIEPVSLRMIKFVTEVAEPQKGHISFRIKDDLLHLKNGGITISFNDEQVIEHYCLDIVFDVLMDRIKKESKEGMMLRQYIEAHFTENVTNETLCRLLNCSEVTLLTLSHTELGMTPHRFLTNCRLEKAKTLLLLNEMTASEIAFECGYDDALYFSRIFSKYCGVSPTAFRKMARI